MTAPDLFIFVGDPLHSLTVQRGFFWGGGGVRPTTTTANKGSGGLRKRGERWVSLKTVTNCSGPGGGGGSSLGTPAV